MMQKLSEMALAAYLSVTGFFCGLKNDERGVSGVVVAVMLILVAVLAVALLWLLLGEQIATWWTELIEGAADEGFDAYTP